jgi:glycine hydroxymethyltransferase
VLLNLRGSQWSGRDAEDRMHAIGLTVNRNAVPFDERPPAVSSGIRIGTPAATMRGLDADDFREVGRTICGVLEPDADLPALSARVDALLARRPLYAGLRGYPTYDGV